MNRFLLPLLLAAPLSAAPAPDAVQDAAKARLEASPRHQEWVELPRGERKLKAFVVYPEKKGKATAVVLIHEIMGLTPWVMSVADRLAENGFIAVAPDFVSGLGPGGGRTDSFEDVGKVREAVSGLPAEQVLGDVAAASEYARTLPAANGKVSVGGFCWGGAKTFAYAASGAKADAFCVFYGSSPAEEDSLEKVAGPVHGFYGEDDARVNATLPSAEKLMKAAKKTFRPVVYVGAGHGFMRAGEDPAGKEANRKAKDAAWKRWLKLLKTL
jgi:carboxymethylenebutenolidase